MMRRFNALTLAVTLALAACTGSPGVQVRGETRDTVPARAERPASTRTGSAPAPITDSTAEAAWSYRLTDGWMSELKGYDRDDPEAEARDYDVEHRGECRGRAVVRGCATGDCWMWSLRDVKCTGQGEVGSVDLLNSDDPQTVRKVDGYWVLEPSLPGMGDCTPTPTLDADGELVRLNFACSWKCSAGDPCEGGAEYEFTRNSARGMISTPANAGALRTRHGI